MFVRAGTSCVLALQSEHNRALGPLGHAGWLALASVVVMAQTWLKVMPHKEARHSRPVPIRKRTK